MLTDDERTEYMLDVEPVLLRDKWATLLVKLNNNKVVTVKTDVTFYLEDDEVKLWGFENPSEFYTLQGKELVENQDETVEMVDVIQFIEVDIF